MNINKIIKAESKHGQRRGLASQSNRANERLAHALKYNPIRPVGRCKMMTITTENHFTGVKHTIILSHDPGNGTDRFNAYLDGDNWRNGLSRYRFTRWLFKQIDSVRSDWS